MGSVWSRLGTEVHVIEFLDHITPGMDKEISKEFMKILIKQGLNFHLETKVDSIKKKMSKQDAIFESARTRVRPIFMSTLTSIFGMFPLVLFPGAGSELYKGLGSVVIGGLFLSAILILIIVPALLTLTIDENKIIK